MSFTNNLMLIKHLLVILAHIPAQYTASLTPAVTEAEFPVLSPISEIPPRYTIKTYTPHTVTCPQTDILCDDIRTISSSKYSYTVSIIDIDSNSRFICYYDLNLLSTVVLINGIFLS